MENLIIVLAVFLKEKFLFANWSLVKLFSSIMISVATVFFLWKVLFDENANLVKLYISSIILGIVCAFFVVAIALYERKRNGKK